MCRKIKDVDVLYDNYERLQISPITVQTVSCEGTGRLTCNLVSVKSYLTF